MRCARGKFRVGASRNSARSVAPWRSPSTFERRRFARAAQYWGCRPEPSTQLGQHQIPQGPVSRGRPASLGCCRVDSPVKKNPLRRGALAALTTAVLLLGSTLAAAPAQAERAISSASWWSTSWTPPGSARRPAPSPGSPTNGSYPFTRPRAAGTGRARCCRRTRSSCRWAATA